MRVFTISSEYPASPEVTTKTNSSICGNILHRFWGKRHQNVFCIIFYKTQVIPMKFVTVSGINLLQNYMNTFYLT